ncbi:histidine kinase dimerization/phosphoacceptor domain -containing protein [Methylocapsa sp. D3K7]|uniref:histidine kinase dimerization/phosphoacceptor domain -containing protein n=1 Tax=Methylocapsa sp. D3K7 TaxID=3041435 RepID=UPI00244E7E05|nr:histidine kinase dimerization/phosphoacceptor domain -containing protein [Methylocapsa sp. D3K7]WGJ15266.1 histidine kinase dimerization/phosphoacceptor domain -containing protein [Methylocapsa sp. D3K7]
MGDAEEVKKLLRQQSAIAAFGSFALAQSDLQTVLSEAARVCASGLGVRFCKVCKYRPDENDLLIVAGFGWQAGVVGNVVSRADASSPQGRALSTGEPSICNDLRKDTQFVLPPFYAEHGIIATIDVLIKGAHEPYGVLEIDSDKPQDYNQQDIIFLTGFANVLAEAVATASRTALLQTTIRQMEVLVEDKNRLLEQKVVLAEELQHRVRNNLQLIYGMLTRQLGETTDESGQRGIRAIARRVSTLAQVYDHLLGAEMTRTTDFGTYVKSLCRSLGEVQALPAKVTLTCDSEVLMLDLDVVTALGIVVAELVTNSYDHAFPKGEGAIEVSVRRDPDNANMATLVIRDDGHGFEPQSGSKRHGLGLVRRLAEQVRGTASVAANKGTVWTITFPLADKFDQDAEISAKL